MNGKAERASNKKESRKVRTVNLDADLHQLVSFVVLCRKMGMADYLRSLIEKQVSRDYAEELNKLVAKQKADEKK